MKVKTIKAVEIEGLGLFTVSSEWENFTKWTSVDGPIETFISVDINSGTLLANIFKTSDSELDIIFASSGISKHFKDK